MCCPVHGWEYRRYVISNIEKIRGVSLAQSEFEYTTKKTNNISNFSAWHNRANLIPKLLPVSTADNFESERKRFLRQGVYSCMFVSHLELDRAHNGLWVDPDDQSTWLYHSWLLGETFSLHAETDVKPILAPTSPEEKIFVLVEEVKMLEELLEEVPNSKCKVSSNRDLITGCLISMSVYKIALGKLRGTDVKKEVNGMIEKLAANDPLRKGLYADWQTAIC
jgi:geranylgeranyl transferase type-2 subunit alpha